MNEVFEREIKTAKQERTAENEKKDDLALDTLNSDIEAMIAHLESQIANIVVVNAESPATVDDASEEPPQDYNELTRLATEAIPKLNQITADTPNINVPKRESANAPVVDEATKADLAEKIAAAQRAKDIKDVKEKSDIHAKNGLYMGHMDALIIHIEKRNEVNTDQYSEAEKTWDTKYEAQTRLYKNAAEALKVAQAAAAEAARKPANGETQDSEVTMEINRYLAEYTSHLEVQNKNKDAMKQKFTQDVDAAKLIYETAVGVTLKAPADCNEERFRNLKGILGRASLAVARAGRYLDQLATKHNVDRSELVLTSSNKDFTLGCCSSRR